MIEGFQNAFRIPELKKRILFTLALLAVYRVGAHIPTPGIDSQALAAFFQQTQGTLLGFFDMFSGGALSRLTIFALGIMPYISASIILELLTVVVPYLEKLKKEGEQGRKKITNMHAMAPSSSVLCKVWGSARPREHAKSNWGTGRARPRVVLPPDDGTHADRWHRLYHVAWGAYY